MRRRQVWLACFDKLLKHMIIHTVLAVTCSFLLWAPDWYKMIDKVSYMNNTYCHGADGTGIPSIRSPVVYTARYWQQSSSVGPPTRRTHAPQVCITEVIMSWTRSSAMKFRCEVIAQRLRILSPGLALWCLHVATCVHEPCMQVHVCRLVIVQR